MLLRHKDKSQDKSQNKSQDLSNARLRDVVPTNNEGTAAWQSCESKHPEDQVCKPSIERVIDAKDWVDNGSRL